MGQRWRGSGMVILRVISQILIALALMLLGADAVTALETNTIDLMSLSEFFALLGLGDAQAGLESWDDGFFRDGLIQIVSLSAWAVFGLVGVLLAWAVGTDDG